MKHTRETVKKHVRPWAVVAWLALLAVAFCVDVARDDKGGIAVEWRDIR